MADDDIPLRYADGPTTEAVVDIAASPSVVWALVSDIDLPPRFSAELQGVEWLDGATGPRLGARFVGRNRHRAIGGWGDHVDDQRVRTAARGGVGGRGRQ